MSASNETRDRLVERIGEALARVRREIDKAKAGEDALDGLHQLTFMEAKLGEMEQVLGRADWRCVPRTKPGIARLVVDTWPMNDPLGTLISEIEYDYGRLR